MQASINEQNINQITYERVQHNELKALFWNLTWGGQVFVLPLLDAYKFAYTFILLSMYN